MNLSIGCLSLTWTNFALDLLDIDGIFTQAQPWNSRACQGCPDECIVNRKG